MRRVGDLRRGVTDKRRVRKTRYQSEGEVFLNKKQS
jgi:hypothetical protein